MKNRCLIILPGSYPPGDAKATRISLLAATLRRSGLETRVLAFGDGDLRTGSEWLIDDRGTSYQLIRLAGSDIRTGVGKIVAKAAAQIDKVWPFTHLLAYGDFWSPIGEICTDQLRKGKHVYADCTEWYPFRPWRLLKASYWDHLRFRRNITSLSGVIGISKAWIRFLSSGEVPAVRVPALVDSALFYNFQVATQQPIMHGAKPLKLGYFGALSRRNLALTLLDVVRQSISQGMAVELHCYGHQALDTDNNFIKRVKQLGIGEYIFLHGFLKFKAEVIAAMHSVDVLLLLRANDTASRGSFPTRLPEMLLSQRPVITSIVADIPDYIQDRKHAFLIPAGHEPRAVVKAIREIKDNPVRAMEISRCGAARAAETFDYRIWGKKLTAFMLAQ